MGWYHRSFGTAYPSATWTNRVKNPMLDRQPDPKTGKVMVTFRLPEAGGAQVAWIAGDWNDWSYLADQMELNADGVLEGKVLLEPGRSYRFRYYLGHDRWENDWHADSYVDNEFGGADSVVTLARNGRADDRA
jgi:1,4-alpha-glucan branching enzyme